MSVIFCGGEMEDVLQYQGAIAVSTSTALFRSAYARIGLEVSASAAFTNGFAVGFAASSQIGLTARIGQNSAITAGNLFFMLADTGIGNNRLRLKTTSANPTTVVLEKYNGTTVSTLATSTNTISIGTFRMDVIVNYAVSGRVRVWFDGVLFIDYSGDVTGGGTTLNQAWFGALRSSTTPTVWSEIIVTDGQDPRTLSLKTLVPDSVGSANAWVGAWSDVDDATASDVDVMSSASAGQVANLGLTGMPVGWSNLTVTAVKLVASAARGATGPSKLALGVRTNSADTFPTAVTLDTGFSAAVTTTYALNPVTGLAWTPAEIDALQLALRSEA